MQSPRRRTLTLAEWSIIGQAKRRCLICCLSIIWKSSSMALGLAAETLCCNADQAIQHAYAACVHKAQSLVLHELLKRGCFTFMLGIVYGQCKPRRLAGLVYSPEVQGNHLQKPQQQLVGPLPCCVLSAFGVHVKLVMVYKGQCCLCTAQSSTGSDSMESNPSATLWGLGIL